jgi:hypothetical protein
MRGWWPRPDEDAVTGQRIAPPERCKGYVLRGSVVFGHRRPVIAFAVTNRLASE